MNSPDVFQRPISKHVVIFLANGLKPSSHNNMQWVPAGDEWDVQDWFEYFPKFGVGKAVHIDSKT